MATKTGKADEIMNEEKSGRGLGAQPPDARAFKKSVTSCTFKFGHVALAKQMAES